MGEGLCHQFSSFGKTGCLTRGLIVKEIDQGKIRSQEDVHQFYTGPLSISREANLVF